MHTQTQSGQWEMRVDYQKNDKTWSYLHYNQFSGGSATEEYQLTVKEFTGIGTDRFARQNNMHFSTSDNENDKSSDNCASITNNSGWWYNACDDINLNKQPIETEGDVIFDEMKIRSNLMR